MKLQQAVTGELLFGARPLRLSLVYFFNFWFSIQTRSRCRISYEFPVLRLLQKVSGKAKT